MRVLATSILGVAAWLVAAGAAAQVPPNLPYLAVQGQAESRVVPDVFPVAITISETSEDPAAAQALVEGLARDVLAAARTTGVAESDLTIGNLRITPRVEWDEATKRQVFTGNEYQRDFTVRLRRLELLRTLAAALPRSRNLQVRTLPFERSDAAEIGNRLRAEAIGHAKAQAESLARAAGVKLGRLQNVSDRPQGWNYSTPFGRSLETVSVSGSNQLNSEMIVKEGQITLRADVYLVYLLVD